VPTEEECRTCKKISTFALSLRGKTHRKVIIAVLILALMGLSDPVPLLTYLGLLPVQTHQPVPSTDWSSEDEEIAPG
jgi:hypothetical protein